MDPSTIPLRSPTSLRLASVGEVLYLARNMGHQRAIAVGLTYISMTFEPAAVVVMDSDGEDRAESIADLLAELKTGAVDAVVALRGRRWEFLGFRAFYTFYRFIFQMLTGRTIRFGNFTALSAPWRAPIGIHAGDLATSRVDPHGVETAHRLCVERQRETIFWSIANEFRRAGAARHALHDGVCRRRPSPNRLVLLGRRRFVHRSARDHHHIEIPRLRHPGLVLDPVGHPDRHPLFKPASLRSSRL